MRAGWRMPDLAADLKPGRRVKVDPIRSRARRRERARSGDQPACCARRRSRRANRSSRVPSPTGR